MCVTWLRWATRTSEIYYLEGLVVRLLCRLVHSQLNATTNDTQFRITNHGLFRSMQSNPHNMKG